MVPREGVEDVSYVPMNAEKSNVKGEKFARGRR